MKANAGVSISNNATTGDLNGAGVEVLSGGLFVLNGAKVKNNISNSNGAGVYVEGSLQMKAGHIDENEAQNGAGIYVANGGTATILGGEVIRNETSNNGAGIYVDDGGIVIANNIDINQNIATNDGAGVYVADGGSYTMEDGLIRNNRTINGNGAGIYLVGQATLNGGTILDNSISSFNENPKGAGVYLEGELHVANDIEVKKQNPIYIVSGNMLHIDSALTKSEALNINTESTEALTKIAKIEADDEDVAESIEIIVLTNKAIKQLPDNKEIVGLTQGNNYYLVYDSIDVTYDRNNGLPEGDLPVDTNRYSGGDEVTPKLNNANDNPITRPGYMFIGWSTKPTTPITSAAAEVAVDKYYPEDIMDGMVINRSCRIFEDTTFYAVWAIDANRNGEPDYRENVLQLTIAPSQSGDVISNLSEARGGELIMITANPGDGYEVSEIEVRYNLNGVDSVLSLENGKVVKLTDTYYYFNMPLADATVYTTFKKQSLYEVRVTWNDGSPDTEVGTLQEALNMMTSQTDGRQGKRVTLLKYIYSPIETVVSNGLDFELDLNGYTLDMNYHPLTIAEGAKVKIVDSMNGGKISFDSSGGRNNIPNNFVNNGTLTITDGTISMVAGDSTTEKLIDNNGSLVISGGSIKHASNNGIAVYNNGSLIVTGGNINGGAYGIYHANTTIDNSFDLSGLGPINTYGVNIENYVSSIYLAKDAYINVSNVIDNCSGDNSIVDDNKIKLYLDDEINKLEPIIKSNRLPNMVKHFRTHFDLQNRPGYEIAVDTENNGVLIETPGLIFVETEQATYPYRSETKATAVLYSGSTEETPPYVGATGKVYFFVLPKRESWHGVYSPTGYKFRHKIPDDSSSPLWGLSDAVASTDIDPNTGTAEVTFSNEGFDLSEEGPYYVFAMFFGEGLYDTYNDIGDKVYGYKGPIYSNNDQQGTFRIVEKDINDETITINVTSDKHYNGEEQNVTVEVYDGEHKLTIDDDYTITKPSEMIDANTYNIIITGVGNYKNQTTKQFKILKYNEHISIHGVDLMYNFGTPLNISFDGNEPTAVVQDTHNNVLTYGEDYSVKYQMLNANNEYKDIDGTPSAVGVYKIVATTLEGSTNYEAGLIAESAFIISDEGSKYEVTFENDELTYNGEERTISELGTITVKRKATETTEEIILNSTDYTAMFGTSSVKNVDTYPVIINGLNAYSNVSLAGNITIKPVTLSSNNTHITFAESEYYYTGKQRVPQIVTFIVDGVNMDQNNGGTPIVEDVDYYTRVTGTDSTNVGGTAVFNIIGSNGNYTGSLTYPYEILPRSITNNDNIVVSVYQSGFSGTKVEPVVTITDKISGVSRILVETVDYTVSYRVKDVANNEASLSQDGYPINKGMYEAVITGINNYTGSKVETFEVGNYKGRIVATLNPNKYTYAGNDEALEGAIIGALKVTRGTDDGELEYGVDYVLGYNTPTNTDIPSEVGDYLLYIVGIGNYDGVQATATYTVMPLTGTIHLELVDDKLVYNGDNQYPVIDEAASYLSFEGINVSLASLEENKDYTVIRSADSKDIGGYTIQVLGIGKCAGNYNFENYQIVAKSLDDEEKIFVKGAVDPIARVYNGEPQTLTFGPSGDVWVEYKVDENKTVLLEKDVDFTVKYSSNTKPGIAIVMILGKGNYNESTAFVFTIEKRIIGNGGINAGYSLTGIEENKSYTGSAVLQEITLKDVALNKVLEEGTDYTISYENNINVGEASFTITGKGNYIGTINGTFNILKDHTISIIGNNSFEYIEAPVNDSIVVKDSLNRVLSQEEYTLTYYKDAECTEVTTTEDGATGNGLVPANSGTYYRKVVGTSTNYLGLTAISEFVINEPQSTTVNISISNTTHAYDGDNHSASIVLTDKDNHVISGDNYTVTYYKDADFENKTSSQDGATINGGAPSKSGTYYVRVVGLNKYSDFNSSSTFVINKLRINDLYIEEIPDYTYTGSAITPKPAISWAKGETTITLIENTDYTYSYADNTNVGVASVIITAKNDSRNYEGQATVTFNINAKLNITAHLEIDEVEYNGAVQKPNDTEIFVGEKSIAELTLEGKTYNVSYGDGNYKDAGIYEITITNESSGNVVNEQAKLSYVITNKALNVIAKSNQEKIYGTNDPELRFITNIATESGLYSDDTFEGSLVRTIGENVGEYPITRGNLSATNYAITYSGDVFTISKKDIADSNVNFTGVNDKYTYTASDIVPNISATYASDKGNLALASGTDFDVVSYEKLDESTNTYSATSSTSQVGKYRINIEGKGNYTGTKSIAFEVETMKAFNASFSDTTKTYTRNPQDPTVKVSSVSGTLTLNTDYIYEYYTDSSYTDKTTSLNGAITEGGAPANVGKYYLRVVGINNYEGCVAESEFRIVPKNIQDKASGNEFDISISSILDQIFTGHAITPSVVVSWGGIALVGTTDYEIIYSSNVDAGIATYKVNGRGNYEGTREGTFTIIPNASGEIHVTLKDDHGVTIDETNSTYIYDGTSHIPMVEVVVTISGDDISLTENTDYIVTFDDTINAGIKNVVVTLTGNYGGSIEKKYLIARRSLEDTQITIDPTKTSYNGTEQKPIVTVEFGGMVLDRTSDYTIDWGTGNYIDTDSYKVTISEVPNGNFSGTVEKDYDITPYGTNNYEIFNIEFNLDKSSYADTEFIGEDPTELITSNIVVKDIDGNVVPAADYTLSFKKTNEASYSSSASSDVAEYMVKATGKENTNYSGVYATGVRGYVVYTDSLSADPIEIDYDDLVHTISNSDLVVKTASLQTVDPADYEVTFGDVEVKEAGEYTIYITGKNAYENATGSTTFKIKPADITVGTAASNTYNGNSQAASFTVKGINDVTLVRGKDYIVRYTGSTLAGSYYDSIQAPTDAGNYTVVVTGRGNYADAEKEVSYKILPKSLADEDIVVTISNNDLPYNVISRTATINAVYNLPSYTIKLNAGRDYDFDTSTEYTNANSYTITLNAEQGNYTGSKDVTFTIKPYTGKLQASMQATFNYGTTLEDILDTLSVKYSSEVFTSSMYDAVTYPSTTSIPAVGDYIVTITAKGSNYVDGTDKANAEVKFKVIPANQTQISFPSGDTVVYNGKIQRPTTDQMVVGEHTIAGWVELGKDCTVDYGDGNYKDVGTYMITSKYKDNGIVLEESAGTFKITEAPVTVIPNSNQFKFYGEEDSTFEFTTDIQVGDKKLYENDSFNGYLVRAQGENVGNYEIKQNGLTANNYDITLVQGVNYEIKPKNISSGDVNCQGVNETYTYTGSAIKPQAIITYDSEKFGKLALAEGNDFTVKYQYYDDATGLFIDSVNDSDLINVGRYKMIVTGINNYTGTHEHEYRISSYVTNFIAEVTDNNKEYNKQIQTAQIVVRNGENLLEAGRDYVVVYYTNNSYTIKTNTSANLGGAAEEGGAPRNAGIYYIKVEGAGNYQGSSSKATFVINPKPISDDAIQFTDITDQTYTGSAITPQVILAWGGVTLAEDTDYAISYSDNIEVGTAKVTITGNGNYTGTREEEFEVVPIAQGTINIELSQDTYVYDGEDKEPSVTVTYTLDNVTTVLTSGDYDCVYTTNRNKGTATVTVTLKGIYSGTESKNFTILPFDLEDASITIQPEEGTYTGKNQNADVVVKVGDTLLVKGTDYTLTEPAQMKDSGTYTYTIKAIAESNYTGRNSVDYTINKYGIESDDTLLLDFNNGKNNYKEGITKSAFESNLTVKDLNRNTLSNDDYIVEYASGDSNSYSTNFPTNPGIYKVRVKGTGTNYAGVNDVAIREFGIFVESVIVSNSSATYTGEAFEPDDIISQIVIKSDLNIPILITYFDISFGGVSPKDVGTYTVIATGKSNSNYAGLTGLATFEILPATITLDSVSDTNYTGKSAVPTMTILGVNNETLVQGKDYTLTYTGQDNAGTSYSGGSIAPTNAGTYTVTVTGIGNYSGTDAKQYKVKQTNISSNAISVEIDNNDTIYNTEAQPPVVNVSYKISDTETIKLTENVDYTLQNVYTNTYKEAGNYTVRIKATETSNYFAQKDVTYTIKPYTGTLDVSLSGSPYTNGITKEEILSNLVVSYRNDTLSLDDLNSIFIPDVLTAGNYVLTVNAKNGVSNYFYSSEKKANGSTTFVVKDANPITISLEPSSVDYSACEIELTKANVLLSGDTIEELENAQGNDLTYTIETGTIKDVGTYDVVLKISKSGNLLQQASAKFNVNPKDISSDDVEPSDITEQVYTGSEIKPVFTLTYSGEVLTSGEDYDAVYKDNKEVGEASIVIHGKGNYKGTKTLTFDIVKEQGNITVELYENGTLVDNDDTYIYDGNAKKPDVVVKLGAKLLTLGADYLVEYSNNINSTDEAKVKVTLKGNYSGDKEVFFTINKASIDEDCVELSDDVTYNKQKQIPTVTVTYGNKILVEGTDYEVSDFDGFEDADTYDVIVTGKGNYEGEVTKQFTINKYGLNSDEILLVEFNDSNSFVEGTTESAFLNSFTIKDIYGNTISNSEVEISYLYNGATSYSSSFASSIGKAKMKVTGTGNNYAGENDVAIKDFTIYAGDFEVSDSTAVYKNAEFTINDILDQITVTTTNGSVQTTNFDFSFGNVLPKDVGSYTMVVTGKTNTNYEGMHSAATFTITPANLVFTSVSDVSYTGISMQPSMTISGVNGEQVVQGKDYDVSYSGDNYSSATPPKDVGTYEVIIEGKDNYTGSSSKTYKILNASGDNLIVEIMNNNTIYNTEEQPPEIKVSYKTLNGIVTLTQDEYTVENIYSNVYKNAGNYVIRVKANDTTNYSGEKEVTYTIKPYTGELNLSLSGDPYQNGITKDEVLSNLTISYGNDVIGLSDIEGITIPDLMTAGNYVITLFAKNTLNNYYDSTSNSKASGYITFEVKGAEEIEITLDQDSTDYTAHEIAITKENVLISGDTVADIEAMPDNELTYTLETGTIKDAGIYEIILKIYKEGILLQQASTTFTVNPRDISDAEESDIDNQDYTGSELEPSFTLTFSGEVLDDDDYDTVYKNNKDVGEAIIVIHGLGNYTGTKTITFNIVADLADVVVKLSEDVTYNGIEQKPSVTVSNGNVLLREGVDYEVTFEDGFVDADTYDVTVTAKDNSNFEGSVTKHFTINQYGENSNEVLLLEFSDGRTSYREDVTQDEFEDNLIVKDIYGNELSSDEFTIEYSSNDYPDEAGNYTVTVTGTGTNYAGSNDTASRAFIIYVDTVVNVEDIEKPFKDGTYEIDDIIDDISIESDVGTSLDKDDFDVSFAESSPENAGEYTIIVTGKSGTAYEGVLGTAKFTITPGTTIEVEVIEDLDYTGTAAKPEIEVKGYDDAELEEGKDYIVTYSGTDVDGNDYNGSVPPTKPGDYVATVTGIGNYLGAEEEKPFSIDKIDADKVDASLSETSFVYNESNQVPIETVKYETPDYTILLLAGEDYDVSYEDEDGNDINKDDIIDVGEYQVIIELKGYYTGTKELDFEIVEKDIHTLNISITDNSKEYSREPQEIELTVTDPKGAELEEGTDYKITYYTDSSFTTKTGTSDGATGSGKAPANSGKYYVKIEGLGKYSEVSSSSTFIITKKSVDDLTVSNIEDQIFDGTAKKPKITIKDGTELISSDEYSVTYNNNTNVGNNTATATITFKEDSNYKGSKTVNFSIVVDDTEETTIRLTDSNGNEVSDDTYTYDGTDKKPGAVVTHGGIVLVEGKDYTISYTNNKNAGTATATVTLKGDYSGTASKDFTISPLSIAEAEVTAKPEKSTYTGNNIRPSITVTVETDDGKFIKLKSSDYEVVYPTESKKVGTYAVKVNATSTNFTGTASGKYRIIVERDSESSGGGSSTKTKVVEKIIEVPSSGDKPISSFELLDDINHISYISGYEDGTFKPDKRITRAEIVTIFGRLLKNKMVPISGNPYVDIDNHWAKASILVMNELGIVKGYEDGTFRPENYITRAEFATMVSRFANMKNIEIKGSFKDVTTEHWAYKTINFAKIMGWISGYEDGTFKPDNPITRAEAITIINRMLQRTGDIGRINSDNTLKKFTDINGHWAYYGILEATNSHEYEFDDKVEIWK